MRPPVHLPVSSDLLLRLYSALCNLLEQHKRITSAPSYDKQIDAGLQAILEHLTVEHRLSHVTILPLSSAHRTRGDCTA